MDPLTELRDIHLPPAPEAWPPAPGWWLLAALAALALVLLIRPLRRRMQRRRLRQRLEVELRRLEREARDGGASGDFHAGLSTLLRRVALLTHPREQVAALSGEAWLAFLDATGGDGGFREGPGRALVQAPYAPLRATTPGEPAAVLETARRWLWRNLP